MFKVQEQHGVNSLVDTNAGSFQTATGIGTCIISYRDVHDVKPLILMYFISMSIWKPNSSPRHIIIITWTGSGTSARHRMVMVPVVQGSGGGEAARETTVDVERDVEKMKDRPKWHAWINLINPLLSLWLVGPVCVVKTLDIIQQPWSYHVSEIKTGHAWTNGTSREGHTRVENR